MWAPKSEEGLVRPNEFSGGNQEIESLTVGENVRVVVIRARQRRRGSCCCPEKAGPFREGLGQGRGSHERWPRADGNGQRARKGRPSGAYLGIRDLSRRRTSGTGNFEHINLDKFVGQEHSAPSVLEVDREKRKVILSNKLAVEEERGKRKKDTLDSLKEGEDPRGRGAANHRLWSVCRPWRNRWSPACL